MKKNSSPIPRFTSSPIAWRFLSPDAYTPSAAGAPTVSSGGTVTAANWQKMQMLGCIFLYTGSSNIYYHAYGSDNATAYVRFRFGNKTIEYERGTYAAPRAAEETQYVRYTRNL